MSPEQEQELINVYPDLFSDIHAGMPISLFGFECGPGWFDLLKDCIGKIQSVCERESFDVKVNQIKEKYGTLRFYVNQENEEVSRIIKEAERKSSITCENCGNKGVLRGGVKGDYWMAVRCDPCNEIRLKGRGACQ